MNMVPMYSVRGPSDDITRDLHMSAYLREVERQAAIYNLSFSDAMRTALRGDADATFRHIQSALFAAIVVNRLVTNHRSAATRERAASLRAILALPEDDSATPILSMATVRHHLEHVDERLDDVLVSEETVSIADWYLTDGFMLVSPDGGKAALRAFCPRLGVLFYDDESLHMMALDIDLLKLRHNVREALDELASRRSGRMRFGNLKPTNLIEGDDVARWRSERDRLMGELDEGQPPVSR